MEKFTKGEWGVDTYLEIDGSVRVMSNNILISYHGHATEEVIAAAPEMYEMLKHISSELKLCIDECNEHRKITVTCTTITPPDLIDYQTVYEAELLLSKARGEV